MNLKVALPNGRVVIASPSSECPQDPRGYRVIVPTKEGRTTGIVVAFSGSKAQHVEVSFPDQEPVITPAHIQVLVDVGMLYRISPWLLLFELLPSVFRWREERFLKVSGRVDKTLDAESLRILGFVKERGRVKEELLKERFGWQKVELLKEKGFLQEITDWDIPNLEVEIYSLATGLELALERLKRLRNKEERVRLLTYLSQRLYATKEELKQAGFSSKDLLYLLNKGIVKKESKPVYGIWDVPKRLRQGEERLIKRLERSGVIWGSYDRLKERLFELLELSVRDGKTSLVFFPHAEELYALSGELYEEFGDRLLVFTSRERPKDLVKNWFLASSAPKVVVGTRLASLVPVRSVESIIIFNDADIKLDNLIDLKLFFYKLSKYLGSKLFLMTPSLDTYTYKAVKEGFFEEEAHIPTANIRVVERKAKDMFAPEVLRLIKEDKHKTLILVNKSGYSYAYCESCQDLMLCPRCNSLLTLSKQKDLIFCKTCGYRAPAVCPVHERALKEWGFGIDRVVEELERMLVHLEDLEFDTQPPLTKSYHRVVVINADNILSVPSFDSEERYFNYLWRALAVAERELIVQTLLPQLPLLESLKLKDPYSFLEEELRHRKDEGLPPYLKVIKALFSKDVSVGRELEEACLELRKIRRGKLTELFCKVGSSKLGEVLKLLRKEKPISLSLL